MIPLHPLCFLDLHICCVLGNLDKASHEQQKNIKSKISDFLLKNILVIVRRLVYKIKCKIKNHIYQVRFVTYEDYISIKNFRFVGMNEGGQLSFSLVVIHMIDAMKMLLKSLYNLPIHVYRMIKKGLVLLVVHMPLGLSTKDEREGGEYDVAAKNGLVYAPLVSSYLQMSLSI